MVEQQMEYTGGTISRQVPPSLPPKNRNRRWSGETDRGANVPIATHTAAYFRAIKAGFTFQEAFYWIPGSSVIVGRFTCVCGRQEQYQISEKNLKNGKLDIAAFLENYGSFNVKHLRKEDGYSFEEIRKIRSAFV